jgi:hypothetical protein
MEEDMAVHLRMYMVVPQSITTLLLKDGALAAQTTGNHKGTPRGQLQGHLRLNLEVSLKFL